MSDYFFGGAKIRQIRVKVDCSWFVVHGWWFMVHGSWFMVRGSWSLLTVNGWWLLRR
jgi:hypothetical protein